MTVRANRNPPPTRLTTFEVERYTARNAFDPAMATIKRSDYFLTNAPLGLTFHEQLHALIGTEGAWAPHENKRAELAANTASTSDQEALGVLNLLAHMRMEMLTEKAASIGGRPRKTTPIIAR